MNYTDRYFKMPVRIYDGFSVHKAILQEERKLQTDLDSIESPIQPDWVRGFVRLMPDEIILWMDFFSEGTPTEQVSEKGFDLTMVETRTLGKFECTWKRDRFEQELNEFHARNSDNIALR